MNQYIIAFITTIILFLAIQYYYNNHSSDLNKYNFNNGNTKVIVFIVLLIVINGSTFIYNTYIKGNSTSLIDSPILETIPIKMDKLQLKAFETEFLNSIQNQEVDVGIAPF